MTRCCPLLLSVLLIAAGPSLPAQKYSNEFLAIGVGARAQGLGNAMAARTDDVTAGYWNPAGLAQLDSTAGLQVAAMHAEWFAGVGNYDYLGFTLPFADGKRRLGLSLIRFGIDGIPNTLSLFDEEGTVNYDNVVEFSAADYAFLFSFAQHMQTAKGFRFNLGGNVKIVRRLIGSFADSWGFGIDLGAQTRLGNLRLGIMGRDLSTTFNAWSVTFTEAEKAVLLETGNELPDINSTEITRPSFLLGAAYDFRFQNFTLQPELDLLVTTDGKRNTLLRGDPLSMDLAFGLEAGYKDFLFLRFGMDQFQREAGFAASERLTLRPSLGLGLRIAYFHVDYAFSDVGDGQGRFSHVVSLKLDIQPRKQP